MKNNFMQKWCRSLSIAANTRNNTEKPITLDSHYELSKTLRQITGEYKTSSVSGPAVNVIAQGWIRSIRDSKNVLFLNLFDGSMDEDLQVVISKNEDSILTEELCSALTNGACVRLEGTLVPHQKKPDHFEFSVQSKPIILGHCDPSEYPLPKARIPLPTLRKLYLMKARSQYFARITRLRSQIFGECHEFFGNLNDFVWCQTPIITKHDCEGGGEAFSVEKKSISRDFFSTAESENHSYLTVSGQLHLEIMASSISRCYTLGPCFRAERSRTSRHLAEFWMLEAEVSFCSDQRQLTSLVQRFFHHVLGRCLGPSLEQCWKTTSILLADYDFEGCESEPVRQWTYQNLCEWYQDGCPLYEIEYEKACELLGKPPNCNEDLDRESENKLLSHFGGPVIVRNWPSSLKPFYMLQLPDSKFVDCFDILLPNVGEVVGGSLREHRADRLREAMGDQHAESLDWYLKLREYGCAPHGGFGIGLDRLVQFITGSLNIQDVSFLPRSYENCPF